MERTVEVHHGDSSDESGGLWPYNVWLLTTERLRQVSLNFLLSTMRHAVSRRPCALLTISRAMWCYNG